MDIDHLKSKLEYNPNTGIFTWGQNSRLCGRVAGCVQNFGSTKYLTIRLDGKLYLAHRLAWFYENQCWPNIIDHINKDGLDNRIENLRDVDKTINGKNSKMKVNNTSGVNGVYFHKGINKWVAEGHYSERGVAKKKFLGSFVDIECAAKARKTWEKSEGDFTDLHGKEKYEK